MSILVTGGKGQLGQELAELLQAASIRHWAPDVGEVDVTDRAAVSDAIHYCREQGNPIAVIHAAAITNVDLCETQWAQAEAVNAKATETIAGLCRDRDIPLVYVSTDFVFDGRKRTPYEVEDPPHPLNAYGRSKLAGEKAVRRAGGRHYIVRTSWVFGPHGNNFPVAILRAASEGRPLRVVNDQRGRPTYARDLAAFILTLLGIRPSYAVCVVGRAKGGQAPFGAYHFSNAGECSWYEFAKEILRQAGWNVDVQAITSEELGRPARRPAYSVLSLSKTQALGICPRSWPQALSEHLDRLRDIHPMLFPQEG